MELFLLNSLFGNDLMTVCCPGYVGSFLLDIRAELRSENNGRKEEREDQVALFCDIIMDLCEKYEKAQSSGPNKYSITPSVVSY